MRVILMGNAGAGKTTMARQLIAAAAWPVAELSLDAIAWGDNVQRLPLEESLAKLAAVVREHERWVIEGCYSDLIEAALPHCTELRFLNPGIDVCVAHCRSRPWEPEKFESAEKQQQMLDSLIDWVRAYETRDDEYGLQRHRQLFECFAGPKREFTNW